MRHLTSSLAILLFMAAFSHAGGPLRLLVTLEDAVWPAADPAAKRPLRLRLERVGQQWDRLVIADSRRLHQGDHWGALTEVTMGPSGGTFAVSLRIEPDPWNPTSGYGLYRVRLAGLATGDEGTWQGHFNGVACGGKASVVAVPLEPWPGGQGHPCLLLRKDQLPALRDRARTDRGKALLADVQKAMRTDPEPAGRAIGHGLMYQVTGDAAEAQAARRLLEADVPNWNNVKYVHGAAARVVLATLAFDLIAPACDADFRARMREVFRRKCDYLYYPPVGGFNPNDASNWSAMYRSALGLAALSLLAEPAKPADVPVAQEIIEPAPLADAGDAVELVPGRSIGGWRYAGPIDVPFGADATTVDSSKLQFVPLDRKHYMTAEHAQKYRNPKFEGGVDFASAAGRRYLTANFLAVDLVVKKPGLYAVEYSQTKMEQMLVTLGGKRLASGDLVRLGAGRYRLDVLASIGVVGNWEMIEWYLRLNAVTDQQAQAWLAERKLAAAHASAMRQALGPDADIEARRWLGIARQRVANWAETALGENGWNMEGQAYTQHSLRCVLPFELAHRNATGYSVFGDSRVANIFVLNTAATVFGPNGVNMPSYGPGGGPLGIDNWGRGLFIIPEKHRPTALWAWNRTQALAAAGKFRMTELLIDKADTLAAVGLLLHDWPDVREADPSTTLPRVFVDQKKGGYIFRNRWQDGDDFVVSYFLDSDPCGGGWRAPDWTDFRILGLGAEWAARGIAWGNGASARKLANPRLYGNVLYVPEAHRRGRIGAVATHAETRPDGSGIVTANLDDIYLGVDPDTGKDKDIGVRGTRSLAVDYSSASGAPCLVAVHDRVSGTKGQNVWQFCTLAEHKVAVARSTFTITAANGATLVGQVILPADAAPKVQTITIRHESNYHGKHSQSDYRRQVISVPGMERFLVVMTIQKDAPPQPRVEADKVLVGKRAIRVEEGRLRLE